MEVSSLWAMLFTDLCSVGDGRFLEENGMLVSSCHLAVLNYDIYLLFSFSI